MMSQWSQAVAQWWPEYKELCMRCLSVRQGGGAA